VPSGLLAGRMDYDVAGNLVNDTYTSYGSADGTPTRLYDAESRLVAAKDGSLNVVSSYVFDGDGRRIKRMVSGHETWQLYGPGGELLAEYQAGAAPFVAVKEYGYRGGELLVTMASGDPQRMTRFVKNLYYNCLARDASASELQQKTDQLAQAGVQGETQLLAAAKSIARGLFESQEYAARDRTDTEYVTDLYNAYLQRGPDATGLNFWIQDAQNNRRGHTLTSFEVSTEFQTLSGTVYGSAPGGDNQRVDHFIQAFYQGALQREPTSAETQNKRQRLNNAAAVSQEQVVAEAQNIGVEIFESTNYNNSRTDQQYVRDLYEAFLQRAPDGPGLSFWLSKTQNEGRAAALNAFKVSTEYSELAGTLYRETFWLVSDHLGTPRMIVDKSGSLAGVKRHDYLPFGQEIGVGVGGRATAQGYSQLDSSRKRWAQLERDDEVGLDYAQKRYYSSALGRFTSTDEFRGGPQELWVLGSGDPEKQALVYADVTSPQSLNKYQYAFNNPLRYVDPTGQKPQDGLEVQLRADEQALAEGKMSKEEFLDRQQKRGIGAAAGLALVISYIWGPELATSAMVWMAANPDKVEQMAVSVQELTGGPPSLMTAAANPRLTNEEIITGNRLARQIGRKLFESQHVGAEFVDEAGMTFDAIGHPEAYKHFGDGAAFFKSIVRHVNKSVDHVAIDLQGATEEQIQAITSFVNKNLTKAQSDKIVYVSP
jgi:RHS repeat-associated protein